MRILAIVILAALLAVATIGCGQLEETPPSQATPVGSPGAETPAPSAKIIKNLAYIESMFYGYSDDADPEDEGIEISLLWYDTNSEWIYFRDVPISVDIEIYLRHYDFKIGEYILGERVYSGRAHIDSSASDIRIPFADINVAPSEDWDSGLGKLTIHTPRQGDYSIEGPILDLSPDVE